MDVDLSLNSFAATDYEEDEALFISGTISFRQPLFPFISKNDFLKKAETHIVGTLYPQLRDHWLLPTSHRVFDNVIHELTQMTYYHYSSENPTKTLQIQKGFLKTRHGVLITFVDYQGYASFLKSVDKL